MSNSVSQNQEFYSYRDRKTIRGLAIGQIVLGILSIAFGIAVCAANGGDFYSFNGYVGTGIWCGLFSVATGAVGITAAYRNNYNRIMSYTVMNFILLLPAAAMTGLSIRSLSSTNEPCSLKFYNLQQTTTTTTPSYESRFRINNGIKDHQCVLRNGLTAADVMLALIGFTLMLMSLVCIIWSLRAVRRRGSTSPDVVREPEVSRKYSKYNRQVLIRLGVSQTFLGIGCVVFGIVTCAVNHSFRGFYFSLNGYIGTGIWIGVFLVSVGAVTNTAAYKNLYYRIISCMVMNIIGAVMAAILLAVSVASIITTNKHCPFDQYYVGSFRRASSSFRKTTKECTSRNALLAGDSILTIIALAEVILALTCAIISMKVLCRNDEEVESGVSNSNGTRANRNRPSAPAVEVNFVGPAVDVNFDEPGVDVNFDEPGVDVNLDEPAVDLNGTTSRFQLRFGRRETAPVDPSAASALTSQLYAPPAAQPVQPSDLPPPSYESLHGGGG